MRPADKSSTERFSTMNTAAAYESVEAAIQAWPDRVSAPERNARVARIARGAWLDVGRTELRKTFRRLMSKGSEKRGQSQILSEYDEQWRKKGWEKYRPRPLEGLGGGWVWGQRKFLLSNEAGAALRLIYLEQALTSLAPQRVLEVGCGNGINLLLLAARSPSIEFQGIEPTAGGFEMARNTIGSGSLPEPLQAFSPFPLRDATAISRIGIVRGSGASLPWSDDHFDVVFTSLALEQMEEIRDEALRELARVARSYVVMLEPFREVNAHGLRRRYIRAYDYFDGAIADLGRYGLDVVKTITDMPHKITLGTALVIARKVSGGGSPTA